MTKSTSYRETFRRHRLLLIAPIVVAGLIAAFLVLSAKPSYQSTTSVWVDNPASAGSSLGNLTPGMSPPSGQEEQVVNELLSTDNVKLAVANHSSLRSYLAAHNSGGVPLQAEILSALGGGHVLTSTPGPQVLQISFVGPTPDVATSTLRALVSEIQQASVRLGQQHNVKAVAYGKTQVQAATHALDVARNEANAYLLQHPGTSANDPNLTALTAAEGSAGTQLTQANQNLTAAEGALRNGSGGFSVQVIDSPTAAAVSGGGKKKKIEGILGGLFAGALISFLATIALTRGKDDPWEDELVTRNGARKGWTFADEAPSSAGSSSSLARQANNGTPANGAEVRKPRLRHSNLSYSEGSRIVPQKTPDEPDRA